MRISDWSSDVCSSDLPDEAPATLPLWREGSGWLFALLALAAIAGVLYASAPGSGGKDARSRQHPVAPPAEVVPEVAPMELAPVTVEDARTANARVPLIAKDFKPARPFVYPGRSEEHTSELQSLMRISYAVFCLKKKNTQNKEKVH